MSNGLPVAAQVFSLCLRGTSIFTGTTAGVFRMADNGAGWIPMSAGLPVVIDITAFAVIDTNFFAGTNGGIFRFVGDDSAWSSSGIPDTIITSFAVIGEDLFAATNIGGIHRSTGYDTNWVKVNSGLSIADVQALLVSSTNLFAGIYGGGVFLSTNNGANWKLVSEGLTNINLLSLGVSGSYLFAGTEHGIWRRPLLEMTGGNAVEKLPKTESVFTSFPNPFSKSTSIKFSSDKSGFTQVSIHNLLGSEVVRLFTGSLDGGEHSFTWDAHTMPPGMYICIIRASGRTEELPVMLVK
jgi:hypothetical protein